MASAAEEDGWLLWQKPVAMQVAAPWLAWRQIKVDFDLLRYAAHTVGCNIKVWGKAQLRLHIMQQKTI